MVHSNFIVRLPLISGILMSCVNNDRKNGITAIIVINAPRLILDADDRTFRTIMTDRNQAGKQNCETGNS